MKLNIVSFPQFTPLLIAVFLWDVTGGTTDLALHHRRKFSKSLQFRSTLLGHGYGGKMGWLGMGWRNEEGYRSAGEEITD